MSKKKTRKEKQFLEGELICRKGSKKAPMYILLEGTVVVEDHGIEFATFSETGTVVGEMAGLLGTPRTANLRAKTSGRLQVIEDPVAYLKEHPEECLELTRTLASRLHEMDERMLEVRAELLKKGLDLPGEKDPVPEVLEPFLGLLKAWRVRL